MLCVLRVPLAQRVIQRSQNLCVRVGLDQDPPELSIGPNRLGSVEAAGKRSDGVPTPPLPTQPRSEVMEWRRVAHLATPCRSKGQRDMRGSLPWEQTHTDPSRV